MSATLGLLISAALFTGGPDPAAAPAVAPSVAPPPAATAPAATAHGIAPKTVEGLTVVAPVPNKPCSSRDQACIALVVAELKQLYPEQLKRFCFQRTMRAMRSDILQADLLAGLGSDNPPMGTSFGVNSALKTACARDKK
jgi:hypothetical protein